MLRNVLIVKLEKIVHCEFICISFSFVHAPVCANCNYSCNCIFIQKKKKKEKRKTTRTLVIYIITLVSYATIPRYLSFLLVKGGNPYVSKPYMKTKYKCAFCPTLSMKKIQIQTNVDDTHQNCPKYVHFYLRISHLSSNRREQNLALYFQFTTPARKLTHTTKFEHLWMQKDMNFGNARILRHFGPEKRQKSAPERHEFCERHNSLAPWARETPKSAPERHEFWEPQDSLALWAREMPKSAPKNT